MTTHAQTQTPDAGKLAGLLESLQDKLTGDQCAELGVYKIVAKSEELAAALIETVAALEVVVACIDNGSIKGCTLAADAFPLKDSLMAKDARQALANARKVIGGAK